MTTENFDCHIFQTNRVIMFSQPSASDRQEEQVDENSSGNSPSKEADEKVDQLKEFLASGGAKSFEEYKGICGEIKGLLTAKMYIKDLQQRMENSDDEWNIRFESSSRFI